LRAVLVLKKTKIVCNLKTSGQSLLQFYTLLEQQKRALKRLSMELDSFLSTGMCIFWTIITYMF